MAIVKLFRKKAPQAQTEVPNVTHPDNGRGYEYVVKGKKCTSYRCNYKNGVRHGKCTVMTCDNFRFGQKNDWEGLRVAFYRNGQLLEEASWDYSWVNGYRQYVLERELYDKCGREMYDSRERMELTTLSSKVRQTPGMYAQENSGPYYTLQDAFDAGRYFEIVDALVYGFTHTEDGKLPFENDETRDAAIGLYEALAKCGLLENKRNFMNFDDYMVYALNSFYQCIVDNPCDFYVDYFSALPYVVACFVNESGDWRYVWGIRRFYLRYVNGPVSYCMYLMDLMNHLEDFDNNYYTAMEMALETYAFREEGLYELAQAHYNAGNYDIAGCWLIEKE